MEHLSSQTLVTQAANIIEDLILTGKLKVGEHLKEAELEKALGISRTPLREAMALLQAEGLIVTHPRRGRFVKKIDIKEITDISEVRIALEALAVRLAHKHITPKDVLKLQMILNQMEKALKEKDNSAFLQHHEEFHDYLISLSQNVWLEKQLYSLRKLMHWHRFYFQYHEKNFNYSFKSHQLQLKMISDPNCDEDELVKIDEGTTRLGCELLIQHIKSSGASAKTKKKSTGS